MNTFLVISQNHTKRNEWLLHFYKEQSIDPLDITILDTEGSIGIEDIRVLQKSLLLKPLRGQEKVLVIANAHTLTIEAQNTLLKTLEEPPDNTYIILHADADTYFLPTVLSRVSRVDLGDTTLFTQEELLVTKETLTKLSQYSLGDKLKLAETLASDKEKALVWIEKATHILREQVLAKLYLPDIANLENLQQTYTILKTTNVNIRFALENLFLQF